MLGQYCGVYVWVLPSGRDELAKLTLAILDYAMHDPPVRITKQVVYYIDEHGLPTNKNDAVGTVTANIAINERNESLLSLPAKEESALEQQLRSQIDFIDAELQKADKTKSASEVNTLLAERKALAAKLEYLKTKANVEGLSNEFVPRDQTLLGPSTPGPIAPNLLQYNQLLDQINNR